MAVVLDAEGLSDAQMQAFARWTNLSETTFLLAPDSAEADYRLRIFTPGGELPFAGHPTLGSCHAWLQVGGVPRSSDAIVQECAAGLVSVRRSSSTLFFAAPPLLRSGPMGAEELSRLAAALGIPVQDVVAHQWVDNGPGWCALLLESAELVLAIEPDMQALSEFNVGIVGPLPAGEGAEFEVRAFVPALGVPEDPVTGSLNAGIGQWLIGANIAPRSYRARQGTALQREGIVYVEEQDGQIWVGGAAQTIITGELEF
ncbi:MAG: PhzF family phenazine biosynthesis protein [Congregibacter sp.]